MISFSFHRFLLILAPGLGIPTLFVFRVPVLFWHFLVFYFCPSILEIWCIILQFFRPPISRFNLQLFLFWACLFHLFLQTYLDFAIPHSQVVLILKIMSYLRSKHLPLVFHDKSIASNPSLGTDYPHPRILLSPLRIPVYCQRLFLFAW